MDCRSTCCRWKRHFQCLFILSLSKRSSKVKMYLITDEDIDTIEREIPTQIVPLIGTMKVHQVFTEAVGTLKYRELSCFCQRDFCSCMSPKNYYPLKNTSEESEGTTLANINNLIEQKNKSIYSSVYSSSSESDKLNEPGLSEQKNNDNNLIEQESIHPSKIKEGVYVLVKFSCPKNDFIFLGKALSHVDDDGEVKIVFLKSVDDTGKIFQLVENDVSYQQYDSLLRIVSEPRKVFKGKRVYYHFPTPLDVFEK